VVLNRVHREYRPSSGRRSRREEIGPEEVEQVERVVARAVGDVSEARELAQNFVDYQALARGESLRIEQFRVGLPKGVPVVQVPNFPRDVHDLASLAAMHAHLFGSRRSAA
jgi:hypothetical protein